MLRSVEVKSIGANPKTRTVFFGTGSITEGKSILNFMTELVTCHRPNYHSLWLIMTHYDSLWLIMTHYDSPWKSVFFIFGLFPVKTGWIELLIIGRCIIFALRGHCFFVIQTWHAHLKYESSCWVIINYCLTCSYGDGHWQSVCSAQQAHL